MRRTLLIVFGLIIGSVLVWLNLKPDRWGVEHEPSATDLMAPLQAPDFAAYIDASRRMIVEATAGLKEPPGPEEIERRLPFSLTPDPATCPPGGNGLPRRGVLLVHGLSDSPYLVRDVANAFRDHCYLARAVLLPGHGTVPGDLRRVGVEAWMAALRYGLESFEGAIDGPLVLAGYSLGVSLSVLQVIENTTAHRPEIAAIVGFAPALHGPFEPADARLAFLQLVSGFPRFQYYAVRRQIDPVKYESFAVAATFEYVALQARIGDLVGGMPLTIPFFAVMSEADLTVPPANIFDFFCHRVEGRRRFDLYSNDSERRLPCKDIVLRRSAWPEDGVLEITHVGITNGPDNPVYGRQPGAYVNCHHYQDEDEDLYRACRDPANRPQNSRIRYGEPSPENLKRHLMRRGMFNPDLESLMSDLLDWLDQTLEAES